MWEVTIKLLDRVKQMVQVQAKRTDPITDKVFAYGCTGLIQTVGQRQAMENSIKSAYEKHLVTKSEDDVILAGLADTVTNALNNWENK